MAKYTVRNKEGHLLGRTDSPEVLVEEICEVCEKQGIIYHVHPESEEHKGSPSFRPMKFSR